MGNIIWTTTIHLVTLWQNRLSSLLLNYYYTCCCLHHWCYISPMVDMIDLSWINQGNHKLSTAFGEEWGSKCFQKPLLPNSLARPLHVVPLLAAKCCGGRQSPRLEKKTLEDGARQLYQMVYGEKRGRQWETTVLYIPSIWIYTSWVYEWWSHHIALTTQALGNKEEHSSEVSNLCLWIALTLPLLTISRWLFIIDINTLRLSQRGGPNDGNVSWGRLPQVLNYVRNNCMVANCSQNVQKADIPLLCNWYNADNSEMDNRQQRKQQNASQSI